MEHLKSIILTEAYLTNPEENLMSMEMILGLMLKEDLTLSLRDQFGYNYAIKGEVFNETNRDRFSKIHSKMRS